MYQEHLQHTTEALGLSLVLIARAKWHLDVVLWSIWGRTRFKFKRRKFKSVWKAYDPYNEERKTRF